MNRHFQTQNSLLPRTHALRGSFVRCVFLLLPMAVIAAPGDVEPGFNPNANSAVYSTAVQADGKCLLGGSFTTVGVEARNRIARLNADGTLDGGFNPNANNTVYSTVVQMDGKILLGGSFTMVGGVSRNRIARLNADGTPDSGFNPDVNGTVHCTVVLADGTVLIGGAFTTVGGVVRNSIARLYADGTLDNGFNPDVNNIVYSMTVQADGKILIGGQFTQAGGVTRNRIARLNASGTLDTGFNPNANGTVYSTTLQADGKILLAGAFSTVGGGARSRIARLNTGGTLDTSFNPNAGNIVYSTAVQADGKILIGGTFTTVGVSSRSRIARLNADGTLDSGFNPDANSFVYSTAVQADGKILIGGDFATVGGVARNRIARLENGTATQVLGATSASRVQWLRGGGGPEFQQVTFELSTDGGFSYAALGAGTRISGGWELTGLSLPANGRLRGRARTSGGYTSGSGGLVEAVAVIGELSQLEIWRQFHFASSENTGVAADSSDFDGDGVANLLEFAFNLIPTQSTSCQIPQAQMGGGELFYSFTEPGGVSGVTYGVEWSTTLYANDWHDVPDTGSAQQHHFSVPLEGTTSLFMRLKVTSP